MHTTLDKGLIIITHYATEIRNCVKCTFKIISVLYTYMLGILPHTIIVFSVTQAENLIPKNELLHFER